MNISKTAVIVAALTLPGVSHAQPGAFFPDAAKKNASAAVAIDQTGTAHMAYVDYVPQVENPRAVYMRCTDGPACTDASRWTHTPVGQHVTEVQLAVNAAGQPRMLLRVASNQQGFESEYHYAECNEDCTKESSWKTAMVRGIYGTSLFELNDDTSPQRSFALDPQGRPRFVYIDRNYPIEPDHMGSYYMFCDWECTNPDNWRETRITETTPYDFEPLQYASLTFTRSGAPRLVGDLIVLSSRQEPSGFYYFACDQACDRSESWKRTYLVPRGSEANPSWDIELDAQDRPRVAYYVGSFEGGGGNHLFYLWCDENCLDANNWYANDPGLGQNEGRHPDLELSADGRPRIAYMFHNTAGVSYLWCDAACESGNAQWQAGVADTTAAIEAEYPVARPSGCDAGLWTTMTPSLALDPSGNPLIAYDAKYDTRCLYKDPKYPDDPPYYRFHQLWRVVRGVSLSQP